MDDTKVQSVWFVKHTVFIFNSLYFCFFGKDYYIKVQIFQDKDDFS